MSIIIGLISSNAISLGLLPSVCIRDKSFRMRQMLFFRVAYRYRVLPVWTLNDRSVFGWGRGLSFPA